MEESLAIGFMPNTSTEIKPSSGQGQSGISWSSLLPLTEVEAQAETNCLVPETQFLRMGALPPAATTSG